MAADLIEKPLTEAQRIIARLEDEFGMTQAEIAQAVRVKADTIFDIKRRKTTGNVQLRNLRRFLAATEGSGNPAEIAGMAFPGFSPPDLSAPSGPSGSDAEPAAFQINAAEPEPAPKRGFMEGLRAAMLGDPASAISQPGMAAPSRRKSEKSASGDSPKEDFVAKITPIAALLFVIAIRSRFADPYKPVAPQPDEMRDILEPWLAWMAKQLDIRGKLTEDANIVLASLVATGLYGVRAYETYQMIHAEEVQRARSNTRPAGAEFVAASGGGNAAPTPVDAGTGRGVSDASAPLALWRNKRPAGQATGAAGREPSREPASGEQRRADASIDALLAADHAGRLRLGL